MELSRFRFLPQKFLQKNFKIVNNLFLRLDPLFFNLILQIGIQFGTTEDFRRVQTIIEYSNDDEFKITLMMGLTYSRDYLLLRE